MFRIDLKILALPAVTLFFPRITMIMISIRFPKLLLSSAINSTPVTHLALFQKYNFGTISLKGAPCLELICLMI